MATEAHDLYELLGVQRNASADDIRKAYRALARQYHPDVNADPAATERFKQIQGAYEILSDPSKRQRYDTFGQTGSAGSPFTDIGDIFEMFFGPGVGQRSPRRASRSRHGESIGQVMHLTFDEAAFGVTKDVSVEALERCGTCLGNGAAPGTLPARCGQCGGNGQIQDMSRSIFGTVMTTRPCPACEGTGERIESPCPGCRGDGRVQRTRVIEVQVPAGVSDGLELRVSAAGNAGRAGGGPGDLYVALEVEPHPVFERRGQDLFTILDVPMTQAALGADLEVHTLDRIERLRLEPGAASGEVLRVKNAGVPNLGKRGRGDLFITVQVVTPEPASKEERKLIEQLAEARGERPARGKVSSGALRRPEAR